MISKRHLRRKVAAEIKEMMHQASGEQHKSEVPNADYPEAMEGGSFDEMAFEFQHMEYNEVKPSNGTSCQACASMQTEITSIKQQLAQCLTKMDVVIRSQAKAAVLMERFFRQKEKKVTFPISNVEDIFDIEDDIVNNKEKYISAVAPLIKVPLAKCLPKIIKPNVLKQFNYRGLKNKMCFKDLRNLNDLIFNCLLKEGYTKEAYQKDMQYAFYRIKNNIYKRASVDKKKKSEKQ